MILQIMVLGLYNEFIKACHKLAHEYRILMDIDECRKQR